MNVQISKNNLSGKVILTSLTGLTRVEYDEALLIVRSAKEILKESFPKYKMTQIKALSPSSDLFYKYLKLSKKLLWNAQSFNEMYVPQFIDEIVNGCQEESFAEKGHELNKIYQKVKAGKTIAIVCFCPGPYCHRYIVGGLLAGVGVPIISDREEDINKYYQMYLERRNQRV